MGCPSGQAVGLSPVMSVQLVLRFRFRAAAVLGRGEGRNRRSAEVVGALVVGGDLAVDVLGVVAVGRDGFRAAHQARADASNMALNSFSGSTHCQPWESTSPAGTGGAWLTRRARNPGFEARRAPPASSRPPRPDGTSDAPARRADHLAAAPELQHPGADGRVVHAGQIAGQLLRVMPMAAATARNWLRRNSEYEPPTSAGRRT